MGRIGLRPWLPFLSRVSMHVHAERDIVEANPSVCPSIPTCYPDERGRSAFKGVGINREKKPTLESRGVLPPWDMGVVDSVKTSPSPYVLPL